jgi:hypothetical protein
VILAVAKYYGPGGKSIPDNAVTPSLVVNEAEPPSELGDDQPVTPPKSDEDLQLKKAVEVLTVGPPSRRPACVKERDAASLL